MKQKCICFKSSQVWNGYSWGTRIVSNNDYRNDIIEIMEIDDDDT